MIVSPVPFPPGWERLATRPDPTGSETWTMTDLALFDLAINSKLRACGLVRLRVRDACCGQITREPCDQPEDEETAS
jgi:hypothetical protein